MTKILFMGRKSVAAEALSLLAADTNAELVGVLTDSHLEGSLTAKRAEEFGIPLLDYDKSLAMIENGELEFDLGLSILYWRKIRQPMLAASRYGIMNFHPAPLPEYKGVGGYNLAILEARADWAVSAHYVDEEIDTGEIISVRRFPIDNSAETAQSLERTSMAQLRDLFVEIWRDFSSSPRMLPSKPNVGGKYLSRRELEELKRIDPNVDDVDRKVRAFWFPPYDGAYLELNDQKFTLVNRSILESLADPSASSLFSPKRMTPPGSQ